MQTDRNATATPVGVHERDIRKQLAVILESDAFRGSKRCHDFLVFAVDRTLSGDINSLKERTLATEVFGRKTGATLGDDSIVRVGAREVRKRLAQYYVSDGADDQVRIDLPLGSYVPTFHLSAGVHHQSAALSAEPAALSYPQPTETRPSSEPQPKAGIPKVWWWLLCAATLVSVVISVLAVRERHASATTDFDVFWQPVFSPSTPVLIGLAHPLVYHPSDRLGQLDEELNGPQQTLQRPVNVPSNVKPNDYVPVFDQYIGFGDGVAATKLALLLAQHGRSAKLRLASKVDFADMRDSPTILIGAFTNRWTTEIVKNLRYRFERERGRPWIVDSVSGRKWLVVGKADNGETKDDYILLCRLPHTETGKILLIGAGLTQYGTEEAGRILSDPDALTHILHRLPPDWRDHNMQIVLYAQVVGDTPTAPDLVASYVW
jgi:hypothetical protein